MAVQGKYKWGYKSPIWFISIVTLVITLFITTHEPPSGVLVAGRIRLLTWAVQPLGYGPRVEGKGHFG